MSKAVDLTQEIYQGMPVYPGHLKTVVWEYHTHAETEKACRGGFSYTSRGLLLCDHGPTHVDAVNHFDPSPGAPSVDEMPLDQFYGTAICLDLSQGAETGTFSKEEIQKAEKKSGLSIEAGDIVLFYLGHYDRCYGKPEWLSAYCGFSKEASAYLCQEKKIKNWGVDAPSTDTPGDLTYPAHMVARATGVPHMENLCNLDQVAGKRFEFYGFPLKIRQGSGSPIRAVAILED